MRFVLIFLSAVQLPFMLLWIVIMLAIHSLAELLSRLMGREHVNRFEEKADTNSVTVIIPTWNGKDLLDLCLPSLEMALRPQDKIIVVDNASTDGTFDHIRSMYPKVQVLLQSRNGGFRGGCNAGLQAANSDIVIFLNNDMIVDKNFLIPLLEPFKLSAELFAVTSQIFFWDGEKRREETGFTRGEFLRGFIRPTHVIPGSASIHPILYAGGGSSAYDRRKLMELGGFDDLYDPFYVEDLDLSYKAWMNNWPSIIAPESIVYHKHRGTIGNHYRRQFIDATVQRNNILFSWRNFSYVNFLWHCTFLVPFTIYNTIHQRSTLAWVAFWKAVLRYPRVLSKRIKLIRGRQLLDSEIISISKNFNIFCKKYPVFKKYLPNGPLRVLWVCPYSPVPPSHGGAVRMYHLIKYLAEKCDVYVLSFTDTELEERTLGNWSSTLSGVYSMKRRGRGQRSLMGLKPDSISEFYYPEFAKKIEEIVDKELIQIVQYEYTQMAQYVSLIKEIPSVVTEHDVSSLGVARRTTQLKGFKKIKAELSLISMFFFERRMLRSAARVYSVTPKEGQVLRDVFQLDNVCDSVPSGSDVSGIQKVKKRLSVDHPVLLFVGSFKHAPNVEGYLFFHEEILPHIIREIPNVEIWVVGSGVPDEISVCANEVVKVKGFVQDIDQVYQSADVVICPILSGAGVRIKLLESMAYGVPFVSTSVGAEGIMAKPEEHFLLADEPVVFAHQVTRLIRDSELWCKIADQAYELVREHYAWDNLADRLLEDYFEVIGR